MDGAFMSAVGSAAAVHTTDQVNGRAGPLQAARYLLGLSIPCCLLHHIRGKGLPLQDGFRKRCFQLPAKLFQAALKLRLLLLVISIPLACLAGKILPHSAVGFPHILKPRRFLALPGPVQIRICGLIHPKQRNAYIQPQTGFFIGGSRNFQAFCFHQPFCFFVRVIPQGQRGKHLQATFVGPELRKLPGTRHLSPVLQ